MAALRERHRAKAAELGIDPGRIPTDEPAGTGWLTTLEAAALLGGVTTTTATRIA